MGTNENVAVVLETFRAVEQRDRQRLNELYHPEVEFRWPPALMATLGTERVELWDEPQPTPAEREMEPRVIGASGDEVVVLWQWRATSPGGECFVDQVLGLYRVRDGKFARAQMFFFDASAVADFIARVRPELAGLQRG